MNEYLDLEAESPESGDKYEEDTADEEATRQVPNMHSGGDKGIRSPLPKRHRINKGGPSHVRKKMVRRNLQITVIPEEEEMQLTTDLLITTLQPTPAQEDASDNAPPLTAVLSTPIAIYPVCTDELPLTSGADALIDTQVVPPSSPITGLVSLSKLQSFLLILEIIFIMDLTLLLSSCLYMNNLKHLCILQQELNWRTKQITLELVDLYVILEVQPMSTMLITSRPNQFQTNSHILGWMSQEVALVGLYLP